MGPDTQVEIRNISCAQMHINISITAAGNGAYDNFCNVLKFKRFMLWCGDQITPILPDTWNQCFINMLQWYWRLPVQCGETDDEGGILNWYGIPLYSYGVLIHGVFSPLSEVFDTRTHVLILVIGDLQLCINFVFLFRSIHLIFMENFINVIMKRNKFHAMTYALRHPSCLSDTALLKSNLA